MYEQLKLRLTVSEKTDDFIKDYAEKNNLKFQGQALDKIIEEFIELTENNWSLKYIAETVSNEVNKKLSTELNRIRLGTNNTDRNTQVLIELMNGHMDFVDCESILTTNILEVEPLTQAKKVVHERITNQTSKKHN